MLSFKIEDEPTFKSKNGGWRCLSCHTNVVCERDKEKQDHKYWEIEELVECH